MKAGFLTDGGCKVRLGMAEYISTAPFQVRVRSRQSSLWGLRGLDTSSHTDHSQDLAQLGGDNIGFDKMSSVR